MGMGSVGIYVNEQETTSFLALNVTKGKKQVICHPRVEMDPQGLHNG